MVAVSSSNPAHTFEDVLTVVMSVMEEFESRFTHENIILNKVVSSLFCQCWKSRGLTEISSDARCAGGVT